MVDYILNNVSKDYRLKLETGDFQEAGIVISFYLFEICLVPSTRPEISHFS